MEKRPQRIIFLKTWPFFHFSSLPPKILSFRWRDFWNAVEKVLTETASAEGGNLLAGFREASREGFARPGLPAGQGSAEFAIRLFTEKPFKNVATPRRETFAPPADAAHSANLRYHYGLLHSR